MSAPTSDEQVEAVARALYNVSHAHLISWEQAKADDTPWARGAYEHARAVLAVFLPREEVEPLRDALEPLLLFHESGGHEGDGSDDQITKVHAALTQSEATTPASSDVGEGCDCAHQHDPDQIDHEAGCTRLSNKGEG